MQTEQLDLGGIPALVWGPPSDGAVVAVHGNLSHKADTPIQLLAEATSARALQVLSFDLPGHGGRKDEPAAWEPASAWQPTRTSRWNRRCSFPLSWICGGSLKT